MSLEAMLADLPSAPTTQPSSRETPYPGDQNATWTYWGATDTMERGVPIDWVWERLRARRDQLLTSCDWRVVPDAPWDTAPWIAYRQELRDLPNATMDPRLVLWPTPPQ